MADNKNSEIQKIPVNEDVLVVGRRTVEVGTVRVSKTTQTRQVVVDEPVISEEVQIERRRLDRFVSIDEPPVVRTEGDTTVIPVLEEVLVVEKRLVLREEVRITRVRHVQASSHEVALRRGRVQVERSAAATQRAAPPSDRSNPDESESAGAEMTQSVVAVFESREQADLAREELIADGLPRDQVSVHVGSGADPSAPPSSTAREEEGGIGHFFRSLFGLDDDRPTYYEEAARRGHATLVAHAADEEEVEYIRSILERFDVVDIDERATQWRSERALGEADIASGRQDETIEDDESATIPVIEEDLQVGKREVERGRVRVYTRVMERPVEADVHLREERASVTREPADRPATEADLAAFREGSMEIRERAEIPVVQKQARVVEEVQVRKQVNERTETVRDKVRKTEVRVEETEDAPVAAKDVAPTNSGKPRRR